MNKVLKIFLSAVAVLVVLVLIIHNNRVADNYQEIMSNTPSPRIASPSFSEEANKSFNSLVGNSVELNVGITIQRLMPLYPQQSKNVTFVVFNHTEESVVFRDQGFGLSVFSFNHIKNQWVELELPHVPYPEEKFLPPKTDDWNSEINNSWDLLENDTTALGTPDIRIYISGYGESSHQVYGAYLDVHIPRLP